MAQQHSRSLSVHSFKAVTALLEMSCGTERFALSHYEKQRVGR
jgi:hypothetical protein